MSTPMMVAPSPELDGDIRALGKVSPNVHADSQPSGIPTVRSARMQLSIMMSGASKPRDRSRIGNRVPRSSATTGTPRSGMAIGRRQVASRVPFRS